MADHTLELYFSPPKKSADGREARIILSAKALEKDVYHPHRGRPRTNWNAADGVVTFYVDGNPLPGDRQTAGNGTCSYTHSEPLANTPRDVEVKATFVSPNGRTAESDTKVVTLPAYKPDVVLQVGVSNFNPPPNESFMVSVLATTKDGRPVSAHHGTLRVDPIGIFPFVTDPEGKFTKKVTLPKTHKVDNLHVDAFDGYGNHAPQSEVAVPRFRELKRLVVQANENENRHDQFFVRLETANQKGKPASGKIEVDSSTSIVIVTPQGVTLLSGQLGVLVTPSSGAMNVVVGITFGQVAHLRFRLGGTDEVVETTLAKTRK